MYKRTKYARERWRDGERERGREGEREMKSQFQKMNKEIAGFIRHTDQKPKNGRPVMFWFYSDQEENIARLAEHLQYNGYRINNCGYSEAYRNYLCIAETVMSPGNEQLDRLFVDMQLIADRMNVEFDGCETRGWKYRTR